MSAEALYDRRDDAARAAFFALIKARREETPEARRAYRRVKERFDRLDAEVRALERKREAA